MPVKSQRPCLGIVGGMGPSATADLFEKVIEATAAPTDQDHLRVLIDSNTAIGDRTEAIASGSTQPLEEILRSAHLLTSVGAQCLVMPCNTAHFFYSRIVEQLDVPFLNMIEETAKELELREVDSVLLLATDGTVTSGVYQRALDARGIICELPGPDDQRFVMDLIYRHVKAGDYDIDVHRLSVLLSGSTSPVVLGCTELPVLFQKLSCITNRTLIDPTRILARAAVAFFDAERAE